MLFDSYVGQLNNPINSTSEISVSAFQWRFVKKYHVLCFRNVCKKCKHLFLFSPIELMPRLHQNLLENHTVINYMEIVFFFLIYVDSYLIWKMRRMMENDRRLDVSNTSFFSIVLQRLRGGHRSPHWYSCLEDPHGQQSLVGYSLWGRRVGHNWATKHGTEIEGKRIGGSRGWED